jgi:hypothetical protein
MTNKERFFFIAGWALVFLMLLLMFIVNTASAQSCPDQARKITTNVSPNGLVNISSPNVITRIDFSPNANARYQPNNFNSPTFIPAYITPNTASVSFYLTAASAGVDVTVQMTVTDVCGQWPTFAGAGPAVFPTAGPLATVTPMPTTPATPITPQVIPTATPSAATTLSFWQTEVLQGNSITVTWANRVNPTVGDFVALTNTSGNIVGPPIYTSSCTSSQGAVAKKSGSCVIKIGSAFPANQYLIRLYVNNNSNNLLLTASPQLNVVSSGGALFGKGQIWGTAAQFEIPEISLIGGFVGAFSFLSTGDPGYAQSGDTYHHLGVADFGLLGENFVEAGAHKVCSGGSPNFCQSNPYMSWMDNTGTIQQVVWDGFNNYPNIPLPLSNVSAYRFAVYEVTATQWTADFCDLYEHCCPIWQHGIPCTGIKSNDLIPYSLRLRFPWIFGGSETRDPRTPAGTTSVSNYSYCCEYLSNDWRPLDCWHYPWDTYDKNIIFTQLTGCAGTPGDWYAISGWR